MEVEDAQAPATLAENQNQISISCNSIIKIISCYLFVFAMMRSRKYSEVMTDEPDSWYSETNIVFAKV